MFIAKGFQAGLNLGIDTINASSEYWKVYYLRVIQVAIEAVE
jgi:hypothetical protein